jgi:hypothetical protein
LVPFAARYTVLAPGFGAASARVTG